jgi:tRNA A-37 threonylcarbamoyl transferase component Bud32
MEPARWAQVRELFESLVDCDDPAVAERLREIRRHDAPLADEVASLLEHHSQMGAFLAEPAVVDSGDNGGLMPGTRLGAFVIEREAGRGGMGRVYVARDTKLDRRVCLKLVRPELLASPLMRERLAREARLAAAISHPGICTVHALEEIDGRIAIVTEFVDGRTLREIVAEGPMPSITLRATFRQLAVALAVAHDHGITHGDLKPENIMCTADGQVKILDFGVARAERDQRGVALSEVLAGTLTYMAPEQINGAIAAPASDVFSLGIVMYECATGVHPFAAPTALATTARILEHEPTPVAQRRPGLPPAEAAAIDRSLRKEPSDRFASGGVLLQALDDAHRRVTPPFMARWWRVHQSVLIALYLAAATVAWGVMGADRFWASRWSFIAIGVLGAIAAIVRGHLLFTSFVHYPRLTRERQRARRALVGGDLLIAVLLFGSAATIADARPVAAVLTMGLAVGIAAAALVIEPATTAGAFGENVREGEPPGSPSAGR